MSTAMSASVHTLENIEDKQPAQNDTCRERERLWWWVQWWIQPDEYTEHEYSEDKYNADGFSDEYSQEHRDWSHDESIVTKVRAQ